MAADPRDLSFMERAILLAHAAQGHTRPNPPVGAVLVNGGRVVGQGHTQPAGHAHAEVVALRQAGEMARGSSLYVTLEPCTHYGRTPPCVDAIIRSGVIRAVVASIDPNPVVQGNGIQRLSQAGIQVALGVGAESAAELLLGHASYLERKRPFVTLVPGTDSIQRAEAMSLSDAVLTEIGSGSITVHVGPPQSHTTTLAIPSSSGAWLAFLEGLAKQEVTTLLVHSEGRVAEALQAAALIDRRL